MFVASRLSWHAEWTFSGGATHGSRASQRRASFLWRGGGRSQLFRSLSSYGCENRASWNGGAGWVEKCASALICGTPTRDSLRGTNDKYKESSGIAPLRTLLARCHGPPHAGSGISVPHCAVETTPGARRKVVVLEFPGADASSRTAPNSRTCMQCKAQRNSCTMRAALTKLPLD